MLFCTFGWGPIIESRFYHKTLNRQNPQRYYSLPNTNCVPDILDIDQNYENLIFLFRCSGEDFYLILRRRAGNINVRSSSSELMSIGKYHQRCGLHLRCNGSLLRDSQLHENIGRDCIHLVRKNKCASSMFPYLRY